MKIFDRFLLHYYAQEPPKFLTRMETSDSGPVTFLSLWQVMVAPLLVLFYAGLFVSQSWDVLLGVTALLLLGGALLALVRAVPSDRNDDIWLP